MSELQSLYLRKRARLKNWCVVIYQIVRVNGIHLLFPFFALAARKLLNRT